MGEIFKAFNDIFSVNEKLADKSVRTGRVITARGKLTERRKAEHTLVNSEAKYRRLFEAAQDGILILNADTGQITDVNPYITDMLGYSAEELVGKELWQIGPFKDIEASQGAFHKLQSQGYVRYENLPLQNKNGNRMAVEFVSNVYMVNRQRVIQCNIRDITEREQIEKALKTSEMRYRRLFEAARDGILVLDADTGAIIDVNPFMIELLGFSHKQFLGMTIWELGLLKDIIANQDAFLEMKRKGFVHYEGLPLETPSGLKLEVEFVSHIYEVDHLKVIQCDIRDITQRKRAEEEQERLSRLLQAQVSELETFSYGIAHDLRSPLVSIEGFSRLLLEDIQNMGIENVQEDIRQLESGVKRMHGFLNGTLEYSHSGHLIERVDDVSFDKIAREVITELNDSIAESGATVTLAKSFPRICVDRSRIKQVLTNLIQNSIRYRDKAVPLKIEVGHYLSEKEIVYFVRDNGTGIDASEAEKVFTLFYRGTADGEGSGIGLSIVRKIIEAHGGKIWVQPSQSEKGTTMCFTLPKPTVMDKDDSHEQD
ncbi:MAG: PAS domain S-box protein [Dehalococcoidales bacterium]